MRILFLTQYFPPEVGAPQNRIKGFAVHLKKLGTEVEILTGMPNYPTGKIFKEYKARIYSREIMSGIPVHRIWLFTSPSKTIIPRLLNYLSFAFSSLVAGLFLKHYNLIVVESPPLFLGITGFLLSRLKGSKFVFNISDLWPESVVKLDYVTDPNIIGFFTRMEEWLYKRSDLITVQTRGIYRDIKKRLGSSKKLYVLYNGIDSEFWLGRKSQKKYTSVKKALKGQFVCGYIGNHGHAQGLDVILKAAEKLKKQRIKFLFAGDGPEKTALQKQSEQLGLSNVIFHDPVNKRSIPALYSLIDLAVIPLRKISLFKGAIPSKMFEFMASRTPVLLGVQGEAASILKRSGAGKTFIPDNAESCAEGIMEFYGKRKSMKAYGNKGREFVFRHFNREKIALELFSVLKNII